MDEIIKPINDTKRYFISNKGYCFKISKSKEVEIPINMVKGVPKVRIQNEKRSLVYLMVEYFIDLKYADCKFTYKLKNNRLPIENIKYNKLPKKHTHDERIIFEFKCREKSYSHNSRVNHRQKISHLDILNTLKRNNFNCFYCNDKIKSKKWHLDHVVPISKGGINSFNNIVPSCRECNLMKGGIDLDCFIKKCKKINNNFLNK